MELYCTSLYCVETFIGQDMDMDNVIHIQLSFGASNSDGSNTMDDSNWFESPVNFPYISK